MDQRSDAGIFFQNQLAWSVAQLYPIHYSPKHSPIVTEKLYRIPNVLQKVLQMHSENEHVSSKWSMVSSWSRHSGHLGLFCKSFSDWYYPWLLLGCCCPRLLFLVFWVLWQPSHHLFSAACTRFDCEYLILCRFPPLHATQILKLH